MMKIAFVNNSLRNNGVSRYAFEVYDKLKDKCEMDHIFLNYRERGIERINVDASTECINSLTKIPIDYKYLFYYRSQKRIPKYDLYHITNQNLSFLNLKPKIITCLDIIHHVYPQNKIYFLFSRFLYSGLKNAEFIISISKSTKKDLMEFYSIPEEKIKVIYLGINHNKFNTKKDLQDTYKKYSLSPKYRYIFHISSETPRKNVDILIKAFYRLRKNYGLSKIKLLKAGNLQYQRDRRRTLNLVERLNLQKEIIFLDNVQEEYLANLYNIADLFVFPSIYEGFGLPPLEAMACGTPVITSNTSSLPEVVGDAGIMVNPYEIDGLAKAMYEVLTNNGLREDMIKKGLRRAKMFSWERTAKETLEVYQEVYYEN